jgi:hypothetical protein
MQLATTRMSDWLRGVDGSVTSKKQLRRLSVTVDSRYICPKAEVPDNISFDRMENLVCMTDLGVTNHR